MKSAAPRLDALVWTLIFGGLFVAGTGVALARRGAGYGSAVLVSGLVLVAIGIVLIWVRSRIGEL